MAITWITYEIAMLGILSPVIAFFLLLLYRNFDRKKNSIVGHLTILLMLFWGYFLTKLSPMAWECVVILGCKMPPLQTVMEIIVTGYLVAIIWHLWWNDKDIKMFGKTE